jgi:RNA polymerase sigma factor (TIGR02999 family)
VGLIGSAMQLLTRKRELGAESVRLAAVRVRVYWDLVAKKDPTDLKSDPTLADDGSLSSASQPAESLFLQAYKELRRIAGSYFREQAEEHTLQPTALVHEAFLRLVRHSPADFTDRTHFIAVAAIAMRQILVEHARRRSAKKRGGQARRLPLDHPSASRTENPALGAREAVELVDILALDAALTRLQALSPRQARIVELLCFGGLTVEEVARMLEVSKALVEKDWRRARAYLKSELAGPDPEGAEEG